MGANAQLGKNLRRRNSLAPVELRQPFLYRGPDLFHLRIRLIERRLGRIFENELLQISLDAQVRGLCLTAQLNLEVWTNGDRHAVVSLLDSIS